MDRKKEKREVGIAVKALSRRQAFDGASLIFFQEGALRDYKLPTPGNQLVPLRLLKGPR